MRAPGRFAGTNTGADEQFHGNDGSSGKTTKNRCANMLGSIPGASKLLIECGLFLYLFSDVGKLLQVLDVPCMGCGELDHIHGGGGHGWR